jgi:sacsin
MVDFLQDPSIITSLADQFAPYEAHGLTWGKEFNGTLFRLPLRTEDQAEESRLSKRSLSPLECEQLLRMFAEDASSMLVFLKSVESITIQVWEADGRQPVAIASCAIQDVTLQLQGLRCMVNGSSGNAHSSVRAADFCLDILCIHGSSSNTQHWEICNQFGGGRASTIADNPNNALLKLIPFGGVAALCQEDGDDFAGAAYCFLPLPISTQLPVHVNGFFELSSNRRDVWQAGADMTGDGRTRADWNYSLMESVISPAYVRLLLRLKSRLGFSPRFQAFFPTHTIPTPWSLGNLLLICICNFHVLNNLLLNYICKLHLNLNTMFVCQVIYF